MTDISVSPTNTTWIQEMREAMNAMKRACIKNHSWTDCYKCPFDEYCTALDNARLPTPTEDAF